MSLILKLNFLGKRFKIDSLCALCASYIKSVSNSLLFAKRDVYKLYLISFLPVL
jgi:hypothetical protein